MNRLFNQFRLYLIRRRKDRDFANRYAQSIFNLYYKFHTKPQTEESLMWYHNKHNQIDKCMRNWRKKHDI